jgi:hypothetical protein
LENRKDNFLLNDEESNGNEEEYDENEFEEGGFEYMGNSVLKEGVFHGKSFSNTVQYTKVITHLEKY